jgi:serine protease 16
MSTLAEENGALIVALEHRFYGVSYPTPDMSTENLKYLSSDQALGDLARFIDYISSLSPDSVDSNASPPLEVKADHSSSKWVSFGGSYPGSLATWLKLKYPASVAGTVGSSAPVKSDYNFFQYAQVVGDALRYTLIGGSDQCYSVVEDAMKELHESVTISTPMGSSKDLPDSLKPCTEPTDEKDLYAYESNVYGNFQGTVQYNLEMVGAPTVADLCSELTKKTHKTALDALGSMTSIFFEDQKCVESSWNEMIDELRVEEFDGQSAMRQWVYQSCNEFGYFQTTEGDGHPFTALKACTVEIAGKKMCEDAYQVENYTGPKQSGASSDGELMYAADETYGALDVQGSNITMPNGNCDPWHALGIVNATSPYYKEGEQHLTDSEQAVFIDGTAHCRDMYAPDAFSPSFEDTASVIWAHEAIRANVAKYIQK